METIPTQFDNAVSNVMIPSPIRGHAAYWLPAHTTRAAVEQLRVTDQWVGYLGDWHSHPMNASASGTERATLLRTAARRMRPTHLLVARRVSDEYVVDISFMRGFGITLAICSSPSISLRPSQNAVSIMTET